MTRTAGHIPSGRRASGSRASRREGGFTYVGLVILVAIIGLVAATTIRVGVTMQRAQAERDLLHIGEQFSDALKSYAAATPAGQPQQPPTLKELLKDPRYPGIRRHLRKIFVDPMTGKAEWGVIYMADNKGVLGIYSLATAAPIKVANFPSRFQSFDGKKKISDWVFTFDGQPPPPPGMLPGKGQPGQPGTANPMTGAGTPSTAPAPAPTPAPATPMTGNPKPAEPDAPEPAEPPAAEPAETAAPAETPAPQEQEPDDEPKPGN